MKNKFSLLPLKNKISKKSKIFFRYFISFILPVIICSWLSAVLTISYTIDKEKKQKNKAGKELVKKIRYEISESLKKVRNDYEKQDTLLKECGNLINYAEKKQYDSVTVSMIRYSISFYDIEPVYVSYNAMDMQLIEDVDLKMKLINYENNIKFGFEDQHYSLEMTLKIIDMVDDFFCEYLSPDFTAKKWNIDTGKEENYKTDIQNLLNNNKFIGLLKVKTWLEQNRYNYQTQVISSMDSIVNHIDKPVK